MSADKKQLNIRLREQMCREFKAKCALDGFSQEEAIEGLVRAYLANRMKITRKNGDTEKVSSDRP
jgi:hypothetical protein